MNDLLLLLPLWEAPKHGYRLKKEAGLFLGANELHNNIVYPLLRRFASQGLIRKKVVKGERGQNRQLYSLTPRGREEVVQRLREFGEPTSSSAEQFLLRAGMFGALETADRERILAERERVIRERAQMLARVSDTFDMDAYGSEVIRYLTGRLRFESAWIKRLRRMNRRKP
jgi:DNA-binding PadR family transcriptional regulator